MSFPKILSRKGSTNMGLQFSMLSGSPFLKTGTTFATLNFSRETPVSKQRLKGWLKTGATKDLTD